jgi:hypothetical protein
MVLGGCPHPNMVHENYRTTQGAPHLQIFDKTEATIKRVQQPVEKMFAFIYSRTSPKLPERSALERSARRIDGWRRGRSKSLAKVDKSHSNCLGICLRTPDFPGRRQLILGDEWPCGTLSGRKHMGLFAWCYRLQMANFPPSLSQTWQRS